MSVPSTPAARDPRIPTEAKQFAALVGDKLVEASARERITRSSPAYDTPVSVYPRSTAQDVEAAIRAARTAVDGGPWAAMSGADRAKLLLRVAQLIDKNRKELALIESLEVGKPLSAAAREMQGSIGLWEFAATLTRHAYGDVYDKLGGGLLAMVLRQPVGVVGMITPWNYPLLIVSQKLPFALAMGCTAVVKPSELTSGTALRLGELLLEAGLPPGVVSFVVGEGPEVGEPICRSDLVDMISFTGSTRVGRQIGRMGGEGIKRVSLELGGKSAQIVCADADLELAAEKVTLGFTRNAGQACVSGSRLLVERSVADKFVELVAARMHGVKVGDPLDAGTDMGPLVSRAQFDRVSGFVEAGKRDGAQLRSRSTPLPLSTGYFYQPGIFTNVQPSMAIAQEEIFGPVLSVMPFDSLDEAVTLANSTVYGLSGGVWTRDINKAFSLAKRMKTGNIEINTYLAGAPELPLTGHKQSGVGHEKGRYAIDEFTEMKTIQVQLADPSDAPTR
jgi:betaine-aldehyde dehydrogenase